MKETVGLDYNDRKGFFYLKVNDSIEAKMTFVFAGEHKIIIDHTEVNTGNNGKGYGKKWLKKR